MTCLNLTLEPTPHVVLDDLFHPSLVAEAARSWPDDEWPGWHVYDSPLEKKRACNEYTMIPAPCRRLLFALLDLPVRHWFAESLCPDPGLWGAGMHSMGPGDHLDLHLDSDRHPHTGLERRLNAILFLTPDWREEWGGKLELWHPDLSGPAVEVLPRENRLVLFATNDASYHGVPFPIACLPHVRRKSLAVYWWGKALGTGKRPRARFVGLPGEVDPVKEQLRRERSHF